MKPGIKRIAVIGGGNMGGSIVRGLVQSRRIPVSDIFVTAKSRETIEKISTGCPGISTGTDNGQAVKGADLVIVAVKPWQLESVMGEIKEETAKSNAVIVSVVAGVSFVQMREMLGRGAHNPLFRVIPNTGISLGKSVTFLSCDGATDNTVSEIEDIFSLSGKVFRIPETMMPAGTSLASCGIAFALKYLLAAMDGGESLGFTKEEAREIVMATMEGAMALLKANGSTPQEEIDKVTTPGGLTLKGLEAMEDAGFTASVKEGLLKSR